jgi:A/G-specific adenine glycosylase
VASLAASSSDDVMKAWAGLGYYSRARNLKACAETVAARHGGRFPDSEADLLQLPGIGAYTAAAIAAIAFDRPAAVVDGNVERVVTRLFAIDAPMPAAKAQVKMRVAEMLPAKRPGDFAQATMDLGATICSPKRPRCMLCPLNGDCQALARDDPERFPVKAPKRDKPARRGAAFVAVRPDGAVLLRRRPATGLLGGMTEPPTTGWNARQDGEDSVQAAPFPARWRAAGSIRHVFTHFELTLAVYRADDVDLAPPGEDWWWSMREEVAGEALPTVMKKAIEAAIPGITARSRQDRDAP